MNNKEKIKQILIQVEKIRLKTQIRSQKLQDYLYYQHLKLNDGDTPFMLCGVCGTSKNQVADSFKRAYKTLTDIQKAEFYLLNVKNLHSIMNSDDLRISNCGSRAQAEPKKYKIRYKIGSMFKSEVVVSFQVLQRQKILRIIENNTELDLHNYLLRKSKNKQIPYLVLQSTQPNPVGDTIRITQDGIDFEEIQNTVTNLWKEAQYQNIVDLLKMSGTETFKQRNSKFLKPKSEIEELKQFDQTPTVYGTEQSQTNKNYHHTAKLSQKIEQEEDEKYHSIIQTFVSFQKFDEVMFGEYHEKNGLRVRKTIRLNTPNLTIQKTKQLIKSLSESKKRKPNIKSLNLIGQGTIYEIHEFQPENSIIFMYKRKQFTYHNSLYILEKSEPTHLNQVKMDKMQKADINHCIWRIRQIGNKIQVFVQAKIQYSKNDKNGKMSRKYTSLFIGELGRLLDWKGENINEYETESFNNQKLSQINQFVEEEQFFTVPGSLIQDNNHEIVNTLEIEDELEIDRSFEDFPDEKCQVNSPNLLNFKHIAVPSLKGQKKLIKSEKGHWLWEDEWIIKDNGDLVNVNQEKINIQSSVLKLVAKRMGRNLLSGKSILNTSLPIQIFGTDSNMQRLLRGYIFAPIFLEKAVKQLDPLERFKQVICFAVGFSLAYIIMEKPFNPILGETYQGVIDGCPVYGQQISHHPPITSLLMLGRGYKVFGTFEAKVEMGLNTAAGINEGFNNVQFENNQVIRFSSPPGELSGLIYGDRKITVARKSYYIDETNKLFCEIQWGKNKSSKNQLAKFNDFFTGKIVKVKPEANLSNYKNLKPTDIMEELGEISGRLTQKVCFNNICIFDVTSQVPYQIEQYTPCLCSDSRLRKDIIMRKKNEYILAQQAKQQLENIQRRDRKLRSDKH